MRLLVLTAAALAASAGAALAFVHFPRTFDRASPRHALRTYERLRGADDALGVHGASPALAPFYVDGPVSTFGDLPRAFMFLDKSELTDARHFLALRRDDLRARGGRARGEAGAREPRYVRSRRGSASRRSARSGRVLARRGRR